MHSLGSNPKTNGFEMELRSDPDMMSLSRDLLTNIMARLDGPTIATLASTCTELRSLARDQALWRRLCQSTWPSTTLEEGQSVISSSPVAGFNRFYADSYPLLVHDYDHLHSQSSPAPATDFASFVDIYFHHKCIFSKVLESIPHIENLQKGGSQNSLHKWFMVRPFTLELLSAYSDEAIGDGDDIEDGHLPLSIQTQNGVIDHSQELQKAVRLSWVLLEKTKGRAVNLSSWKPLMVKKSWLTHENYEMSFGCIIPVEENVLVKCHLATKCKLVREGCLRWEEISLWFEDIMGAHLPGSKSLMIMNRALQCLRVRDHHRAHKCYRKFELDQQGMMRKRKTIETILDWLCVSIEVTIFVTATYCISSF